MSEIFLPKDMLDINILLVEDMTFYHSIIPQILNNHGFSGEVYSGKTLKETEKTIKELYKSGKKLI